MGLGSGGRSLVPASTAPLDPPAKVRRLPDVAGPRSVPSTVSGRPGPKTGRPAPEEGGHPPSPPQRRPGCITPYVGVTGTHLTPSALADHTSNSHTTPTRWVIWSRSHSKNHSHFHKPSYDKSDRYFGPTNPRTVRAWGALSQAPELSPERFQHASEGRAGRVCTP